MFKKNRLLTPGPTEVPPETLLAMAQPVFHHRTARYQALQGQAFKDLQYVFQTQNPVLIFAASGTGAMEAAIANVIPEGEKVLVVAGGKFGERFGEICETHKIPFVRLDVPWGKAVSPAAIEKALKEDPKIGAVTTALCETSTGVLTDIRAIGEAVRKTPALLIVDGISSAGAVEFWADAWGVDLLVNGSQKALMLPPGLAFLTVSEKARKKIEKAPQRTYYFDLQKALSTAKDFDSPYTPAVSLVVALAASLAAMRKEGIEEIWKRHRVLADAARAGVKALGLALYADPPSDSVTAVSVPPGIDGNKIPKIMQDEYGVAIAGGQEELSGKIFRISHMGYVDRMDVLVALSALEMTLQKLGHKGNFSPGAAVCAAERVFLAS